MSNHTSMLTENDLDAVSGGKDTSISFSFFGIRISITTFDTPKGTVTCTNIRGPKGGSHDCTGPM